MGLDQGIETEVFPKFIPIPKLAVVETFPIVVVQGMEIDVPVVGKIIRKTVVPPVAITEENEFGSVVKRDGLGIFIGPVQSCGG